MSERELRELVSWTVEDPPPAARLRRVAASVAGVAGTVATFGATTGGRAAPTWTRPSDPDAYVDLGLVQAQGDAPWLGGAAGKRHRLRVTSRKVLVEAPGGRRPPVPVPLADLRIVGARPRGRGDRVRHAHAPWTLTLEGAGTVEVQGAWLALAWIGHLAGWPEPAVAGTSRSSTLHRGRSSWRRR